MLQRVGGVPFCSFLFASCRLHVSIFVAAFRVHVLGFMFKGLGHLV